MCSQSSWYLVLNFHNSHQLKLLLLIECYLVILHVQSGCIQCMHWNSWMQRVTMLAHNVLTLSASCFCFWACVQSYFDVLCIIAYAFHQKISGSWNTTISYRCLKNPYTEFNIFPFLRCKRANATTTQIFDLLTVKVVLNSSLWADVKLQ